MNYLRRGPALDRTAQQGRFELPKDLKVPSREIEAVFFARTVFHRLREVDERGGVEYPASLDVRHFAQYLLLKGTEEVHVVGSGAYLCGFLHLPMISNLSPQYKANDSHSPRPSLLGMILPSTGASISLSPPHSNAPQWH